MTVRACSKENIEDKKRRPAENKREKDNPENFARFLFSHYRVQCQRLSFISIGQESEKEELKLNASWRVGRKQMRGPMVPQARRYTARAFQSNLQYILNTFNGSMLKRDIKLCVHCR